MVRTGTLPERFGVRALALSMTGDEAPEAARQADGRLTTRRKTTPTRRAAFVPRRGRRYRSLR